MEQVPLSGQKYAMIDMARSILRICECLRPAVLSAEQLFLLLEIEAEWKAVLARIDPQHTAPNIGRLIGLRGGFARLCKYHLLPLVRVSNSSNRVTIGQLLANIRDTHGVGWLEKY